MIQTVKDLLYSYFYVEFNSDFDVSVLIGFFAVGLLACIVRVLLTIGYQTNYSMFLINAKDIKSIKEIRFNTSSRLLNRVIIDYIKVAERGVNGVSTTAIVNRHVRKIKTLFLSSRSLETFTLQLETSLVLIGIGLAAFMEQGYIFLISAIAVFCITRLLAIIFNFLEVRENIENDMTIYVDREIGQYYVNNMATSIQALKLEIKNVIQGQSKALGESIDKLGLDISGVMKLSIQEMGISIERQAATLVKPLSEWGDNVVVAKQLQEEMNKSINDIGGAAQNLKISLESLSGSFVSQNEYFMEYKEAIYREIGQLSAAITELSEIGKGYKQSNAAIEESLKYVAENQRILEAATQSYEMSLENITTKLSDGMGSILKYNMEMAYNSFNDNILDNINKIIMSNSEFYVRLQKLFEQLAERNKNEAQAILSIKEQMDTNFDGLSKKLESVLED